MPTLATTVMELREAEMLFEVAGALDDSDASSSDEENADMLRLAACEPLMRRRLQNIGPERLSLARLQREYAARGFDDLDVCTEVTTKYMFRLEDLPSVVAALDMPAGFRTETGVFSGEEGVLLLLRRFRTTDSLDSLTFETGRGAGDSHRLGSISR